MILITTAGKVGSQTSRLLAERGIAVRVIVRSAEKAVALPTDGVDVFDGDLEVPASVDAAMQGVLSVVLVTPPVVQQELNVIDSAVRAVHGRIEDKAAFRAALRKADFQSVRGPFAFDNNQYPIQNIYADKVVKNADGTMRLALLGTIATDCTTSITRDAR